MGSNDLAWRLADLPPRTSDAPSVMSTFACGGGSSLGYKLAGYNIVAANDIDPEMAKNYKANLNPPEYFLMPISELVEKARAKELPAELYKLDVLDGSPPCSSFSLAGSREKSWGKNKHFREGQAEQVLDDLFFDYLNLVDALRPRVSIAENVKGLVTGLARGYVQLILQRYEEIGYQVQLFLLNSADCGVPQVRERVFFVAVRRDLADAHSLPKIRIEPKAKWRVIREAFEGLAPATSEELQRVTMSPASVVRKHWERTAKGENLSKATERAGLPASFWSWFKLHPELPSPTFTATQCLLHWEDARTPTFAEAVRIGSFPDDYKPTSSKAGCYMIGMSVPPRMTQAVAEAVKSQWLDRIR